MDDLIAKLDRLEAHHIALIREKYVLQSALRASAEREKELREALEPFAKYAVKDGFGLNHNSEPIPDGEGVGWVYLTVGDFRRAARALPDY
jgi:hypothetical protein